MKICGVYKIQSKIKPERIYIGSAVSIHARRIRHFWDLKTGIHPNSKLQRHYNKYGKDDLVFSVLGECDVKDLITTEQSYLDSTNVFFNICKKAGSALGRPMSEETKIKIGIKNKGRQTALGRKMSDETKAKINNTFFAKGHTINVGRPCKGETKRKISDKQLGEKNHNYGKHPSIETNLKRGLAVSKTLASLSPDEKLKRSETYKRAWVTRKLNTDINKN